MSREEKIHQPDFLIISCFFWNRDQLRYRILKQIYIYTRCAGEALFPNLTQNLSLSEAKVVETA